MNPIPQRIFNLILIGIGAGIIFLAMGARWYVDSLESTRELKDAQTQAETTARINALRADLESVEHVTEALVAANKTVAAQLASEQAKRATAEAQAAALRAADAAAAQAKINELQADINNAKGPNLTLIVSNWRPRVAQVTCRWVVGGGSTIQSRGSGVLLQGGTNPLITTNRHVVTYNNQVADNCTVKFPDDPVAMNVDRSDITTSVQTNDWAKLLIQKPTPYVKSLAGANPLLCADRPSIGESIVILGYPTVGAQNDITATEGIISGFEGSYFISSAKVEHGNSGGATILAKQNCYLGIPSYVGAGEIESLARILDQHVIQ